LIKYVVAFQRKIERLAHIAVAESKINMLHFRGRLKERTCSAQS